MGLTIIRVSLSFSWGFIVSLEHLASWRCLVSHRCANTDHLERNDPYFLSKLFPPLHHASSHEARQRALPPVEGIMARSIRLFLIRHGETVDNVAQR